MRDQMHLHTFDDHDVVSTIMHVSNMAYELSDMNKMKMP